MDYEKKIKKLEKEFSETNIRRGESLSPSTRSKINKNYYDNQQKRLVDAILNNIKNKDSIKEEVHNIVENISLKELCKNCKEETIIAAIIVYCLKTRDSRFKPDRSKIWNRYGLTWQKYSLIVTRLLQKTREETKVRTKQNVDGEKWVWW